MEESIQRHARELGIVPDDVDLVKYLKEHYNLEVMAYQNDSGLWTEGVVDRTDNNLLTEDFTDYDTYEDAMSAGTSEALAYLCITLREKES